MKNFLSILLGLSFIIGIGAGIFYVINWIISKVLSIDPRISAALITGFLAIVATSLTITIPKYLEKKMEVEMQHRLQKIPMYQNLLNFIFSLLMSQKSNKPELTEHEIVEFMSKFTQDIILWGSDDVIKKYKEYRLHFANRKVGQETTTKELELLENLLLALRKDMGHKNKKLETGAILSLFINDIDEYFENKIIS